MRGAGVKSMSIERLAIVGGGAWGTALAQVAALVAARPCYWAREPEVVESVNATHENSLFLPGRALSPAIRATSDLAEIADADAWLVVTPAQHMRSVLDAAPKAKQAAGALLEGHRGGAARCSTMSPERPARIADHRAVRSDLRA